MEIKIDFPPDVFDAQFPEPSFVARVREFAILDLVRQRRLHDHEAQALLGCERWELVARMEAMGMKPTDRLFEEIRGELNRAIATRGRRGGAKGG